MTSSRLRLRTLLPALLTALLSTPLSAVAGMPRLELTLGMYRIDAEVAANPSDRQQGLMHRRMLPAHQGMLFVFPVAGQHCMWMKNTYLPLSVAFLDRAGRIVNIEDMQPHSEQNHCAARPVFFALEMNRGWFAERRLRPGMMLQGLQRVPDPN